MVYKFGPDGRVPSVTARLSCVSFRFPCHINCMHGQKREANAWCRGLKTHDLTAVHMDL